ncbi:MAG: AAA domain-containing protein [Candidatus Tenebribacter mawsonii]|nr:AAA domain-containing protein [Candidatus Tenebribacter mawsonii]
MNITKSLLIELQNRLKVGTRRGVHLNAIPGRSRYKFDLTRLSHIDSNLPNNFINSLLQDQPMRFKISWKNNVPDLNTLFEDDQMQLVKITKSFENLINQTDAIESEKGINTFGFGFPILIRRDQSDRKLTVAPILIWSLRIKRSKEFNTWVIQRDDDDPIYINEVLINHLQSDSKIEVEQLSSDLLDDGLIDKEELLDICVNLIETINSTIPEDLRDTFREKLENINSISDKKHYEKLPITSNNSFIEFGGLFSIFEVQKQNIIHDYGNLLELEGATIDLEDIEEHSFQPISSVETDPSQQSILHSLNSTRNILIQGPPGTGKSQSLTAILVNALENKKKIIVVCEKRTALEVLHNSLNDKRLNYHCVLIKDIVKDRRVVVNSVRDRVDNSSYKKYIYNHSKENLDTIINKAKSLIDSINKKHLKLEKKLIGSKNWTHIVGSLLSELKGNEEEYKLDIEKGIFKYDSTELNDFLELIRKGHNLYNDFKPNKKVSFLNSSKLLGDNPFLIEQQLEMDFFNYKTKLTSIISNISKYKSEYIHKRDSQLNIQLSSISEIENEFQNILTKNNKNNDFYFEDKTRNLFYKISSLFSKEKKQTILDQKQANSLFQKLKSKIDCCNDIKSLHLPLELEEKVASLSRFKKTLKETIAEFKNGVDLEFQKLNLTQDRDETYETDTSKLIKTGISSLKEKILLDAWSKELIDSKDEKTIIQSINKLIQIKEDYFNNDNDLFSIEFKWFQFYNSLTKLNKIIIDQLLEKSNWNKVFLLYYLNSMLINSANTDLPTNDNDHIELNKSLENLEKEQLRFIREYWFSKQIDSTRDFYQEHANLTVENLYNKRKSNKHRRLSLRQIIEFDIELFTTFFPIILTTPDVCCNLFEGKNKYFDIVMFDEASQLKLEDNLPALLKGKQIVIAGDEHQMPPSNYFSKIFDGSIDDEDEFEDDGAEKILSDGLLSCESLLEFAEELNFEKKYLDFHYRSRHPYLIDFSNYAFYKQRLKPLPNRFEYTPIKYIQVNGTYSDHTNEVEAETVLSIIDNNINRMPNGGYPSVGIATFNIHQRNLILSKINERRKFEKFSDFNEKILELEEDGLFVKNLENIQGDERDVIILTTTYGINKDGKFAQRFGSINHQKGYKLLNVIITRAKYKVYVCSSIPEEVFLNFKEHLSVEGSNNRRAVFYAYLAYSKAVSENESEQRLSILNALADNTSNTSTLDIFNAELESPFEEEVYQALVENFDENKIIPQYQFGGFRIDLVYDSKIIGIPKIAIECDGAAYHSSQEAYLYDKHRQKILEGHGFVFHRIWSTNWWRSSKREINKLVKFIKKIEESRASSFKDNSKVSLAFTDNVESFHTKFNFIYQNDVKETIDSFHKKEIKKTKSYVQKESEISKNEIDFKGTEKAIQIVKLNSEIKIKYLNNNNDITVKIVKRNVSERNIENGIHLLNIASPLAKILIDKSIGEIVKFGKLDNYIEILDVINE